MPGENCAIYGCSSSRRNKGISLWKLPTPNTDFNKKWRADLLNIVLKDRVMDSNLKRQIETDRIYICELHFGQDQLYICKYFLYKYFTKKILRYIYVTYVYNNINDIQKH